MTRPTAAQTRLGLLFLMGGIFGFSAMDALAKFLVDQYPVAQVVWARYLGHLLCVVVYLGPRFLPSLRTALPWWHLARAVTQLGATGFFFLSLSFIGLAEAVFLASVAPVFITLGATFFLGETLGRHRIVGVALGLLGALIVLRPGMGVFSLAAIFPVLCAVSYSANMLLTRIVGSQESPWAAMIYASALGVACTSLLLPFYWHPVAPSHLWAFAALGALGAMSQLFIIRAYSMAEAGVLAPFGYLDMVLAIFWSVSVFGSWPDRESILGALVIAAAGLYVWHRESRDARTNKGAA